MKSRVFTVVVRDTGEIFLKPFAEDTVIAYANLGNHKDHPWEIEQLVDRLRAEVETAYNEMTREARAAKDSSPRS